MKKMTFYRNISDMIGNTPLVRINRLNPYPEITLLAKLESINPGGSVKDRISKHMIEDAIRKGELTRDKIVIEATSGNTGIGIAMICAIKGIECHLVMPESMSIERRKMMQAFGAKVILTSAEKGIDGAQDHVQMLLEGSPQLYYHPNQYDNPSNWMAHYETTAEEILADTERMITHFVAGLGTSGTLMGVGRKLKEELPQVKVISVEPETDSQIQGLKDLRTQYIPEIFDESIIDQRVRVDDFSAECAVRRLALDEGIFVGHSSGAALVGALDVISEIHEVGEDDAMVVTLFADSGYKYLSGHLFKSTEETVTMLDLIEQRKNARVRA